MTSVRNHLLPEIWQLAKGLFRRNWIRDFTLNQPNTLRKLQLRLKLSDLIVMDLIGNLFAYMLIGANFLISIGHPIFGITIFFLYTGRNIIITIYRQFYVNMRDEISFVVNDNILLVGSKMLEKVSFNVYTKEEQYYQQASNEAIVDTIGSYLGQSWEIQNQYWFNLIKLALVSGMLVATIATNTLLPQKQFIPLLVISMMISFITSANDRIHHKNYVANVRKLDKQKSTIKGDLMRVVPIIPLDQQIRIKRFKQLSQHSLENKKDMNKQDFYTDILSASVNILASFVLMALALANTGEITLSTIAELTASLAVFNTAVGSSADIVRILQRSGDAWDTLDKEKDLMTEILKVYHKSIENEPIHIEKLNVEPFSIVYAEQSENDKPFNLILDTPLTFKTGDCVALTGASGSGKSTAGKLFTNRISFNHIEGEKIYPTNYMFYDETIRFGSLSLYEEIFCLDKADRVEPSPKELEKMEYIFSNLFLWKEISESCKDVWEWCKQHNSTMLSNGQHQRMILAKILFWMSDAIDILVLDECTSGLDAENDGDLNNADALSVMKFIIDYCNRDKKRILFISTHQKNIYAICNRRLHFRKENGKTKIKEI